MVVLAIIGLVVGAAISRLGNRNRETKAVLRELVVLSRDLHNKAKLRGATYRIVIDMKDGEKGSKQQYWVERADKAVLMSDKEEERAADMNKDRREGEAQENRGFAPDTEVMKKRRTLPSGIRFEQVELSRLKVPISSGKAFIHFLPQGLVDEAAIHISGDPEAKWTIAIHPLTGKAELIGKPLSLREMKAQ